MTTKSMIATALLCMTMEVSAMADNIDLASDVVGKPPNGWTLTMTGTGNPNWTVEADDSAPSRSNVLKQSGKATYPLALRNDTSIRDGAVEVSFKAVAGTEDRAAGLVWRVKDANNYYVVRANALEDNVVLYKTVNGTRTPLDIVGRKGGYGVSVPVAAGQWHTLQIEFAGSRFKAFYDGKIVFEVEDTTFPDAGQVGLWTKADSVTVFDGFRYEVSR